jgi:hypothetical protein
MKTISYVAGLLLYVTSLNVSAIPITTVGGVYNMAAWDEVIPSSDLAEAQFFADYLSVDVSTLTLSKVASSSGMNWMEDDGDAPGEDLWAFDFPGLGPSLYIIKTSLNIGLSDDGSSDTYSHYLYENVYSLSYGVIDLLDFEKMAGGSDSIDIFAVGHVSLVPEPGMVGLLAIGLLGIVVVRRRLKA